jgi:hypothetical protein
MHAALDLNIKEVVGFYLFSLSLRSRCAVLLLLQCMRPFLAHFCRSATSALTVSFGGIADSLCSLRVLRILTQRRPAALFP